MTDKVTPLNPGAPQPGDEDDVRVDPPGAPLPNARRFVNARYNHPERPLLAHQGGAFYSWDGACWPEVEDAALRAALYEFFADTTYLKADDEPAQFRPNRRKVADLVDALRATSHLPRTVAPPAWIGREGPAPAGELVACANGLLHVPTRTLHELTPRFYAHHSVPFAYNPDAPAPSRWIEFLDELWGDDDASKRCLQEVLGYLISGDTSLQKMFLLVGPKRSGKGTIGRVATGLLGAHNVVGPTLAGLATNFGLSPLIGKPVAIVSDARMRSGREVLTERLLSISGEDTLTIDRKYRDPWTGRLPTRFVILTNELPNLRDSSGALASRFVVLILTRSFYGEEDPTLTDQLLEELPGVFNWALEGWERLRERGRFEQPPASREAIRDLEDLGSPVSAFLRDRCVVGVDHETPVDAVYAAWRAWCDDHGRDRPGTAQTFGRDLHAAVPGLKVVRPRDGDDRQRRYQGLGLRARVGGKDRGPLRTSADETPVVRDGPRTNQQSLTHRDGDPEAGKCSMCGTASDDDPCPTCVSYAARHGGGS